MIYFTIQVLNAICSTLDVDRVLAEKHLSTAESANLDLNCPKRLIFYLSEIDHRWSHSLSEGVILYSGSKATLVTGWHYKGFYSYSNSVIFRWTHLSMPLCLISLSDEQV